MENLITIPRSNVSKADIQTFASSLIEQINEGHVNALEAHIKLKAMIKAIDAVIKATEEAVAEEAGKYPGKSFDLFGANVQMKEGSIGPNCEQDTVYCEIKAQLKDREELLKLAFKQAGKAMITDPTTGEEIPVCEAKGTKGSIAITFK
jgi:hypothetical protein